MEDPPDGNRLDRLDRVLRLAQELADADAAGLRLPDGAVTSRGEQCEPHPALLAAVRLKERLLVTDPDDDVLAGTSLAGCTPGFVAGVRVSLPTSTEGGVLWVAGGPGVRPRPALVETLSDLGQLLAAQLATDDSLALGREIQRELLPSQPPRVAGYELAAHSLPSQELGGDFYDWWLPDERLRLVLADVMGKGVGSSLIAAGVRAMIHAALTYHGPAGAVTRVGGDLETDFDRTARFATCFVADLEPATGALRYVDAGHGIAVVLHADGGYEHLAAADLPLGALPGLRWQQHTTRLLPGDALLVASDGVLERYDSLADVLDAARELFQAGVGLAEIVARLGGRRPADDDITIVGVRRLPERHS